MRTLTLNTLERFWKNECAYCPLTIYTFLVYSCILSCFNFSTSDRTFIIKPLFYNRTYNSNSCRSNPGTLQAEASARPLRRASSNRNVRVANVPLLLQQHQFSKIFTKN